MTIFVYLLPMQFTSDNIVKLQLSLSNASSYHTLGVHVQASSWTAENNCGSCPNYVCINILREPISTRWQMNFLQVWNWVWPIKELCSLASLQRSSPLNESHLLCDYKILCDFHQYPNIKLFGCFTSIDPKVGLVSFGWQRTIVQYPSCYPFFSVAS